MFSSAVVFAATATLLSAAAALECALDDAEAQCGAQATPTAKDHLLLQIGADAEGVAHGGIWHRRHHLKHGHRPRHGDVTPSRRTGHGREHTELQVGSEAEGVVPSAFRQRWHHARTTAECPDFSPADRRVVTCRVRHEVRSLADVGDEEEAGTASADVGHDNRDNIKMGEVGDNEQHTLNNIVEAAASIEGREQDIAGGDHEKAAIKGAAKDLETDERYHVPADDDVLKNAKSLKEAMEKVQESYDVEEAIHDNVEVTAKLLEKVNGETDTPESTDALGAFQGDMIAGNPYQLSLLQRAARDGSRWAGTIWPKDLSEKGEETGLTTIYFCFAGDIHPRIQTVFLEATEHYERLVPCLKFVQVLKKYGRSTDPEGDKVCESGSKRAIFVQSKKGAGCSSYVGMMEQPVTPLQLAPDGCDNVGTAIHELGHALGMAHEQSRVDRDEHVKVYWDNIASGKERNFEIDEMEGEGGYAAPYDQNSIMSFGDDFFAKKPGVQTLRVVGSGAVGSKSGTRLGNRHGLSRGDIQQVASMYGCGGKHALAKVCSSTPGKCTEGYCSCHAKGHSVVKVTSKSGKCHSCRHSCPTDGNTCSPSRDCACPPGTEKQSLQTKSGEWCFACALPQPRGNVTAISMTREMETLLGSGMPFPDITAAIKEAFAKRPPDEVTVKRDKGKLNVIIKTRVDKDPLGHEDGDRVIEKHLGGTWR